MSIAFVLVLAIAMHAWCGEVRMVNGSSLTYKGISLRDRSVVVIVDKGTRDIPWSKIEPESLPPGYRQRIASYVLATYRFGAEQYARKAYGAAAEAFGFVIDHHLYLDDATYNSMVDDYIGYKAQRKFLLEGRWVTPEECEALKEAAYQEAQVKKGLVHYRGQWLTPAQKTEQEADDRADSMTTSKCRKKLPYRVIQALDDGILCGALTWDRHIGMTFTGEVFFIFGVTSAIIADGEEYKNDLYWTGTYSYVTVAGVRRTVNSYCPDRTLAKEIVKRRFGLADGGGGGGAPGPHPPTVSSRQSGKEPKAYGTGFVVTADGYVLTNHHVVEGSEAVRVQAESGPVVAMVVASDPENDIALLKVPGAFTPACFAPDGAMGLGATVFTVGFPLPDIQGFAPKVTKGVVSGLRGMRDDVRMLQIDAAIQPGNSGGPLADEFGNVVGVVSAKLSDAALIMSTGVIPQNVNYALRKSYALALVEGCAAAQAGIKQGTREPVPFEQAVEMVRKSTVMVLVY